MLPRDIYKIVRIANIYFWVRYKIVKFAFFCIGSIWRRLPCQSSSMGSPVVAISSSRLIKLVVSLSTGMVFIYSNYELWGEKITDFSNLKNSLKSGGIWIIAIHYLT